VEQVLSEFSFQDVEAATEHAGHVAATMYALAYHLGQWQAGDDMKTADDDMQRKARFFEAIDHSADILRAYYPNMPDGVMRITGRGFRSAYTDVAKNWIDRQEPPLESGGLK